MHKFGVLLGMDPKVEEKLNKITQTIYPNYEERTSIHPSSAFTVFSDKPTESDLKFFETTTDFVISTYKLKPLETVISQIMAILPYCQQAVGSSPIKCLTDLPIYNTALKYHMIALAPMLENSYIVEDLYSFETIIWFKVHKI